MRLLAFASVLLAGLAFTARASALCAAPGVWMSPTDGSALPPDPTIWIFAADSPFVSVEFEASRPVIEDVTETYGALRVRRVRLEAASGEVELRLAAHPDTPARYRVDPAWERPPASTRGPWETAESRWACSFTDALVTELDRAAPAFEVVGASTRTVLPPRLGDLYGPSRGARQGGLVVGHASCFGWTVPGGRRPDGPLSLFALHPDGSRVPVSLRAPPPKAAFVAPAGPAPTRQLSLHREDPRWVLAAWTIPGLLALALLAGVVVARRRAAWP